MDHIQDTRSVSSAGTNGDPVDTGPRPTPPRPDNPNPPPWPDGPAAYPATRRGKFTASYRPDSNFATPVVVDNGDTALTVGTMTDARDLRDALSAMIAGSEGMERAQRIAKRAASLAVIA